MEAALHYTSEFYGRRRALDTDYGGKARKARETT